MAGDDFRGFFILLAERIAKTEMSAERLDFAIGQVLANCRYRTFTMADVLSCDLRCKVYSYGEMLNEMARTGSRMDDFAPLRLGGMEKPAWIRKADKQLFKIPDRL